MGKIKNIIKKILLKNRSEGKGYEQNKYGRMAVRNRFEDIKMLSRNSPLIIVDGGANVGNMIELFKNYYPKSKIYAFEPIPSLVKGLENKFLNDENIFIIKKALGAENKQVEFKVLKYISSSSILQPSNLNFKYHKDKMNTKEDIKVELVRLDKELKGKEIDILKLDLQGYELEALKGAIGILSNIKIITTEIEFVALYENQPLFGDIDVFLRDNGFRLFNLYELYTHKDGQLTAGDAVYINERYY